MTGKQAKILSTDQIEDLLFFANNTRYPTCNRASCCCQYELAYALPKSPS